jgi:hypothetical protein
MGGRAARWWGQILKRPHTLPDVWDPPSKDTGMGLQVSRSFTPCFLPNIFFSNYYCTQGYTQKSDFSLHTFPGSAIILRIGALAQLGERKVRNLEVRGSIPLCSTRPKAGTHAGFDRVGAFLCAKIPVKVISKAIHLTAGKDVNWAGGSGNILPEAKILTRPYGILFSSCVLYTHQKDLAIKPGPILRFPTPD